MSEYINNALLPVLDVPRTLPPESSAPAHPAVPEEWITPTAASLMAGVSPTGLRFAALRGDVVAKLANGYGPRGTVYLKQSVVEFARRRAAAAKDGGQ